MKLALIVRCTMVTVFTIGIPLGANGQRFGTSDYALTTEKPITGIVWELAYNAQITGNGANPLNGTLALSSKPSGTTVIDNSLNFGIVASSSAITNPDIITIRPERPCIDLGQAKLVSPTGSTTTAPTYVWNSVSGAEKYQLFVNDSGSGTSGKVDTWFTPAEAGCTSGGVCQFKPTTSLAPGAATYYIRAWTSCGGGRYSPWSTAMGFTVF
jgi:hypothetical protein